MRPKTNYKNDIIKTLKDILRDYPNQSVSSHLAIAFGDYRTIDGISDKEFYYAIEKYKCEKELDIIVPHTEDLNQIITEGLNLSIDTVYEDEEEGYE